MFMQLELKVYTEPLILDQKAGFKCYKLFELLYRYVIVELCLNFKCGIEETV